MFKQDEIIEIARQAWADAGEGWVVKDWFDDRAKAFEAFAKLVDAKATAKEREACATVCDDLYRVWTLTDEDDINPPDALDCKRAIRSRGES